jgi:ABC-type Fe3+ transport system permease subunit
MSIVQGVLLFFALCLFVYGLRTLLDKEWAWRQQERTNQSKGMKTERTPEWERSNFKAGMFAIACAIGLVLFVLVMGGVQL